MIKTLPQDKIRNVTIIAHVDHGKTTLVDAFLKQSNLFRKNQEEMHQEQILDTGELEKERGITIKAKNISISYKGYKINIIDTPGHADFGGEVERTLNMAEGCLLLVDAQEGVMPQTRYVLKKAFETKLNPIIVINKIDKKFAEPLKVLDKVNDLMLNLVEDPEQLDFPVFFAMGREGKAFKELPADLNIAGNINPLLDAIIDNVPPHTGSEKGPIQMKITTLEYDLHSGRYLIGKINRGTIHTNDSVVVVRPGPEGKGIKKLESGAVRKLMVREGLAYKEVKSASAGEIVAIAGINSKEIGATLCASTHLEALPDIKISNPSVQIKFEANTSPLMGKEGEFVNAKQLRQRLAKELETNISLKFTVSDSGAYYIAGRGELQLSILIETLRREGYEFQVRMPEVLMINENGIKKEPLEEIIIDAPQEYQGTIVSELSSRKAELVDIVPNSDQIRFTYKILTRNLLGLRNVLVKSTKGHAILNNFLLGHVEYSGQSKPFRKGVIISSNTGTAIGYALNTIQERGDLFIRPGEKVYEGMIIGINHYENDLEVNPTKERKKSGVRVKHDEITQTILKPTIPLTLDFALIFLAEDEILEVTPKNLRLRKVYLTKTERDWSKRKNLTEYARQKLGTG